VVVSGQHVTEALQRRHAALLAERRDVPEVYETVLARILMHETPPPGCEDGRGRGRAGGGVDGGATGDPRSGAAVPAGA
jgi:hypothetical protein